MGDRSPESSNSGTATVAHSQMHNFSLAQQICVHFNYNFPSDTFQSLRNALSIYAKLPSRFANDSHQHEFFAEYLQGMVLIFAPYVKMRDSHLSQSLVNAKRLPFLDSVMAWLLVADIKVYFEEGWFGINRQKRMQFLYSLRDAINLIPNEEKALEYHHILYDRLLPCARVKGALARATPTEFILTIQSAEEAVEKLPVVQNYEKLYSDVQREMFEYRTIVPAPARSPGK